ncbi:uncharacterized protein [Dermacentor albipictus]|uniref:uncharacterized protein n=1 Tax=Dermacentor albipictus TaxID=60249 RepID=UPI0031FC7BA0
MAPRFFNVVAALCCLLVGTVTACGSPGTTSSSTSFNCHGDAEISSTASQAATSPAPTREPTTQGPLPWHDGNSRSSRCSPELAYLCYHELSMKFVIDRWIPQPSESDELFLPFCLTPEEFPLHPQCKFFYSGCFESEKRQFRLHEQGYDFLQFMSTKLDICISPGFLHQCLDASVLRNCALKRPRAAQHLRDFRKESFALVEEFSACINRALEKCDNATDAENLDIVKLVLTATSNLNWFDEDAEPELTTPVPTTSQSTEVPSTTKYTEASTEVTTVNTTPQDQTSTSSATTVEAFTATTQTPAATQAPHSSAPTTKALGVLVLVALVLLMI